MNKQKYIVIVLFLLIVFTVPVMLIVSPTKTFSNQENRFLAQFPEFSWGEIKSGDFMSGIEDFINDQMVLRDTWVQLSTYTRMALGQTDIKNVIIKDSALYTKRDVLSQTEQEQLAKNITYVQKFMSANPNCQFALIPTAIGVYDVEYPNKLNQEEFISSVYSQIGNQTIDIYHVLHNNRDLKIYYNTDHHWTTLGAYYGFSAIADCLKLQVPDKEDYNVQTISDSFLGTTQSKINIQCDTENIDTWTLTNYSVERIVNDTEISDTLYDLTKLNSKEQYAVFLGGNNGKVTLRKTGETGKKLLMVKDSYSHCLAPFLLNEYSEITLIDLRYSGFTIVQDIVNNNTFDDILIIYNVENFINNRQLSFLNRNN